MGWNRSADDGAVSFLGALVGLFFVAGVLSMLVLLDVPDRIATVGAHGVDRLLTSTRDAAYGDTVRLSARSDGPSVEVTTARPRPVVSTTPGVHATTGNRLVAAPVAIRNVGDLAWSSGQGLQVHALDSTGRSYAVHSGVTRTRSARALPGTVSLRPGRTARGLVVFEVPRSARITEVTVTVGTDLTRTAAWTAEGPSD